MHEPCDRDVLRPVAPARVPTASNPRLGIVGSGQLAKITALTSLQLGGDDVVLERNNYSPAANLGHGIAEYGRLVVAAVVVLGAKGLSNLGYVLPGPTDERLLRGIPCSALGARPPAAAAEKTPAENTDPWRLVVAAYR